MTVIYPAPFAPSFPDEHEIPNDAVVWGLALYVCDGALYRTAESEHGLTVQEIKTTHNFTSVKSCNIYERRKAREEARRGSTTNGGHHDQNPG